MNEERLGRHEIDWDHYAETGEVPGQIYSDDDRTNKSSEHRPQLDPSIALSEIRADLNFKEHSLGRRIPVLGFGKNLPGGGFQSYGDRHEEERRKKGLEEAAFFGTGEIGEQDVEIFGINFDFISGSLSTDGGARYQKAIDEAIENGRPIIALYSSAGARQQENGRALMQLRRMVHASNNFAKETSLPHIGVLIGQVWGGVSAGSAPVTDLLVGLRGTDYGFSGPKVIQAYTYEKVPEGEQSVEAHSITRLVDVLVDDTGKLHIFLKKFLDITKPDHKKLSLKELGLTKPKKEQQVFPETDPQKLFDRYQEIRRGTVKPDSEYLIGNIFDDSLNIYDSYQDGEILRYPAIIAAVTKIGPQPFLVVGNQPSYQKSGEELKKIPSSPEPKDYRFVKRMLALGKRLGLPLILFTDTLGAKPTLEAEKQGQAREIAEAISAVDQYPNPVISVITGGLGSGGGLATSIGDFTLMLEDAMLFVAEPEASASILYRTANPSTEDIMQTIKTMGATAKDQKRQGIVDEVIREGEKQETVQAIREAIARSYTKIQDLSQEKLLERRDKIVRKLGEPVRRPVRKRLHLG